MRVHQLLVLNQVQEHVVTVIPLVAAAVRLEVEGQDPADIHQIAAVVVNDRAAEAVLNSRFLHGLTPLPDLGLPPDQHRAQILPVVYVLRGQALRPASRQVVRHSVSSARSGAHIS